MLTRRLGLISALISFWLSPVLAQAAGGATPEAVPDQSGIAARSGGGALCVAGNPIEARSEGAWYPAIVLDPLRDGRCFVHYEDYGSDDDEALAPKHIRARR